MTKRTQLTFPRRGPRMTFVAVVYGLFTLFWLGFEYNALWFVVLLAWGLMLLISVLLMMRYGAGKVLSARQVIVIGLLLGLSVGAGSALVAPALMVLKVGMHGHIPPDYTIEDMRIVFSRLPIWALLGAIIGLGGGLVWRGANPDPDSGV